MSAKPTTPVFNTSQALASVVVASYPFTEGSGATVADIKNGYNFTLANSPTWGTNADGAKLAFNGTNQTGDSSQTTAFATLQNGNFALRIIFRYGDPGQRNTLLNNFDGSGRGFFVDMLANSKMRFLCGYGGGGTIDRYCDTNTTFNTTSIYTMWLILRSGTIEMWRDGTNIAGATNVDGTPASVTSTSSLKLAAAAGGFSNPFYGDFTAIDIFSRAPTTGERTDLDADPWSLYVVSGGGSTLFRRGFGMRAGSRGVLMTG